jgi:hypothetical protein
MDFSFRPEAVCFVILGELLMVGVSLEENKLHRIPRAISFQRRDTPIQIEPTTIQ